MKVEITDILPEFERMFAGYVTCALWASLDDDGESLDSYLDATDISEAARHHARRMRRFRRILAQRGR